MPNDLYPVGTVCRTVDGSLVLITGHNPNRPKNIYRGVSVTGNGTEYIWTANAFTESVPGYDVSHITLPSDKHDDTYAGMMARIASEHERPKWALLAGIPVGGKFKVRARDGLQMATLRAVNPNAPKFPIGITNANGKNIRCHISCVVVDANTPTTTIPAEPAKTVHLGDTFDLLVMDSCETFKVEHVMVTQDGPMARLTHGRDRRYILVEDLVKNRQM